MNNGLVERFIKYCKIDTQSDGFSTTSPSTMKQFDLANVLKDELVAMGVDNAFVDEYCYVYAKIEANCDDKYDKIVFIAHMDTADFNAKGCKPRIIENYDGKDIKLNDEFVLSPVKFPVLNEHKGKTLIVTDGTTLLGADDKAGVAAIMDQVGLYIYVEESDGDETKFDDKYEEILSNPSDYDDLIVMQYSLKNQEQALVNSILETNVTLELIENSEIQDVTKYLSKMTAKIRTISPDEGIDQTDTLEFLLLHKDKSYYIMNYYLIDENGNKIENVSTGE